MYTHSVRVRKKNQYFYSAMMH